MPRCCPPSNVRTPSFAVVSEGSTSKGSGGCGEFLEMPSLGWMIRVIHKQQETCILEKYSSQKSFPHRKLALCQFASMWRSQARLKQGPMYVYVVHSNDCLGNLQIFKCKKKNEKHTKIKQIQYFAKLEKQYKKNTLKKGLQTTNTRGPSQIASK